MPVILTIYARVLVLAVAALLSVLSSGCSDDSKQHAAAIADHTAELGKNAVESTKQTAADVKAEWAPAKAKMAAKLDALDAEMARLNARMSAKTNELSAEAKVKTQQAIDALKVKTRAARADLARLKDASGDAWDAAKGDLSDGIDSMGKGIREAGEELDRALSK